MNIFVEPFPSAMYGEKEKFHEMLTVWPVAKKSSIKYYICVFIYMELGRTEIEI